MCLCRTEKYLSGRIYFHAMEITDIQEAKNDNTISICQRIINKYKFNTSTNLNWANAFYLAESRDVSMGYIVGDDSDCNRFRHFYLLEFQITSDIDVIVCDDPQYKNAPQGDYLSPALKNFVETTIGLSPASPLMTVLQRNTQDKVYAVDCYHDEDNNREFILPIDLLPNLRINQFEIYQVRSRDGIQRLLSQTDLD